MFTKPVRRQVGNLTTRTETPIYKTEHKLTGWGWAALIVCVLVVIGAFTPKAKAAATPDVPIAHAEQ